MNITLPRLLTLVMMVLFSTSHVRAADGYLGIHESYPHDVLTLAEILKPGRYKLSFPDGHTSSGIILKQPDGTYHFEGATSGVTYGFYDIIGSYYVAFYYADDSPDTYIYSIVATDKDNKNAFTAYNTFQAARRYLHRRGLVRFMPFESPSRNRMFLESLSLYEKTFTVLYTAEPLD